MASKENSLLPIVLASGSPRRKALLEALGLDFTVHISHADEVDAGANPAAIVEGNACAKRDEVARRLDAPALVIAADTLVFLEDQVLSKPRDLDEAHRMLRQLSGKTHQVVTGLALADTASGAAAAGHEVTDVIFRPLSETQIQRFVAMVHPVDRAGAYTVDGPGTLLVSAYHGCYQNVLGLPIVRLEQMMGALGHTLFTRMEADKARFL